MDIEKYKRVVEKFALMKDSEMSDFDFFAVARARDFIQAHAIGLRYFVYMGAPYDRTKGFCRDKIGKVFSINELLLLKDDPNRPAIPEYDPVLHLGGNNCFEGEDHCNHGLSFISNSRAARRRPDLDIAKPLSTPSWVDLMKGLSLAEIELVRNFSSRLSRNRSELHTRAFDLMARKSIALALSEDGVHRNGRKMTLQEFIPELVQELGL